MWKLRFTMIALALGIRASAQAQEAASARVVPVQVTGDAAARFSLVVLGDGYRAADMPRFRAHVEKHLNVLWSLEPFRSYRNYINVYAVEIVSAQSGVTCDPAHRERRTTALAVYFRGGCDDANSREILVDQESARAFARMATEDYDQILTIANTDTYGGIGGSIATTSGGNALGPYITPHELGHSLGRLQDEYTYRTRGVAGAAYTGDEPNSIHHTLLTEEQMRTQQRKWWRWLGEPSEAGGIIGRYGGGQYLMSGLWRPSKHSMMISLGYYFDQVSLERMAQRISGQVELIAASTPVSSPVNPADVLWIETAHPVFHELDLSWEVDGRVVAAAANQPELALSSLALSPGEHSVTVKVVDPTTFVRDPEIRDTSFTAARSWTVSSTAARSTAAGTIAFTSSTQTTRPVSGREVVYVETAHPAGRSLSVTWALNGRVIAGAANRRTLALAQQNPGAGTHRLSATVSDPSGESRATQTLEWTVDNRAPTVAYTIAEPAAAVELPGGGRHYYIRNQFTLKLDAHDDQRGYVVSEFRLNGDGWHHYYGWPDAEPGAPFLFTPRGTTIKELVYGSLSAEGLSPQPWEAREPGWGTHRIEYRARDAAGNIGPAQEFRVTIMPAAACTETITGRHSGNLEVAAGVACLNGAIVSGTVMVAPGASLIATNTRILGSLTATGATAIELAGTTVERELRVSDTQQVLSLFGSHFHRAVQLSNNRTATRVIVIANELGQSLSCEGNRPDLAASFADNRIRGEARGQCAARPVGTAGSGRD